MSAIAIRTGAGVRRNSLNDYTVRWVCLAVVCITWVAGLGTLGISVRVGSLVSQLERPALFLAFAMVYKLIGMRMPRFAAPFAVATDFSLTILQVQTAMLVLLPLSYLAAMPALPLLDGKLSSLDAQLFGFDWDIAAQRIAEYPALERILEWAYLSFTYQAAAVFLIGSIARPRDRNGDFIWSFVFAGILTSTVFVFTPALGKVGHLAYVATLTAIRSGQWNVLDYAHAQGIVTFPSFHTTAAILFVYAARRHRFALGILIPLNVLVIAATVPIGGHYLVDLPAGAAVAVASIAAMRFVRHRLPAAQPAAPSAR